jgi:cytochrome c556
MKSSKTLWLTLILSLFVSTQAFAQDKKPTPEERAYEFRHALFETYAWKMGQLVGAKMKKDAAGFNKHATDLQNLASMLEEGFLIKNNIPEGSSAKPEIWEDFAKFEEKADNFRAAVSGLTKDGAMESFNPRDFGSKNCGGCHRDYKVKD